MCTLIDNLKLRKPKTKKFIAYKVFDGWGNEPYSFCGDVKFEFGTTVWDEEIAKRDINDQSGFQMFAYKKDAMKYAACRDYVCKVEVLTKDIAKVGYAGIFMGSAEIFIRINGEFKYAKAYEVKKFKLFKKNWNKKITKIQFSRKK